MDRMNTADAGFFFAEHKNVPMHVGMLSVFEGPAPSYDDFVELIAAKLPRAPRYRKVVRTAPLHVFRPIWVDDAQFDISYHVQNVAVPAPGGTEELRKLAAKLFVHRLDQARPLWEYWLIDGLEGDRWAVLSKTHHCMVDGKGATDLMSDIFDREPDAELPAPVPWQPKPGPSAISQAANGLWSTVTEPVGGLVTVPATVAKQLRTPRDMLGFTVGMANSSHRLTNPPVTSLNGPIGPHRRWAWANAGLGEVKEIGRATGSTVNDVMLAAITNGFRALLESRGELKKGLVVRALVPVSVRGDGDDDAKSNQVTGVLVNLPVSEPDPRRRLANVHSQMDEIKRTHQAVGAEVMGKMMGFAPPTLLALGTKAAFRTPQFMMQTVATNVPGPRFPLYVLGRRMVEAHPYAGIGNGVQITIAIFSYLDQFSFGITAESRAASDLGVLIDGIHAGIAELRQSVAGAKSAHVS
jgi:WS/DGAT/MGAT family acyltransferase